MRRKQKHKYKAARCLKLMLIQKAVQDTLTASFYSVFQNRAVLQFCCLILTPIFCAAFSFSWPPSVYYTFYRKLIPTARAPITAINAIKEINVPDIYYSTFLFYSNRHYYICCLLLNAIARLSRMTGQALYFPRGCCAWAERVSPY